MRKIIQVGFNEEDYNLLVEKSKELRIKVSTLIRLILMKHFKEEINSI